MFLGLQQGKNQSERNEAPSTFFVERASCPKIRNASQDLRAFFFVRIAGCDYSALQLHNFYVLPLGGETDLAVT